MRTADTVPSSLSALANQQHDAVIRVHGLTTTFESLVVHRGLDLTVRRGEVLGVVGASGTGKSVLLKAIVGLIRPAAGSIALFGEETARLGGIGGRTGTGIAPPRDPRRDHPVRRDRVCRWMSPVRVCPAWCRP